MYVLLPVAMHYHGMVQGLTICVGLGNVFNTGFLSSSYRR